MCIRCGFLRESELKAGKSAQKWIKKSRELAKNLRIWRWIRKLRFGFSPEVTKVHKQGCEYIEYTKTKFLYIALNILFYRQFDSTIRFVTCITRRYNRFFKDIRFYCGDVQKCWHFGEFSTLGYVGLMSWMENVCYL